MMKTKALFTVALLFVVLIGCSNDSPSYKILGIELGKATGETLISYFDNKKLSTNSKALRIRGNLKSVSRKQSHGLVPLTNFLTFTAQEMKEQG